LLPVGDYDGCVCGGMDGEEMGSNVQPHLVPYYTPCWVPWSGRR